MTLTNSSLTAFKHWLDIYTNPQGVDEVGITNGNWKYFHKDTNTNNTNDVVDALAARPFAAFFYGFF